MNNDSIKVANKIISYENLIEIFTKMNEKLVHYKKIYENEERCNKMIDYSYQNWSFKDSGSSLRFDVNFYDDTNIKYDSFTNFMGMFYNRLDEIKSIWVWFRLDYSIRRADGKYEYFNQHINMNIHENSLSIDLSLSSSDNKIEDIYELIRNTISNAPVKYDKVIKKKTMINNSVGLAIGLIPSLFITASLLFVTSIRHIFALSYVLYPICTLILALIIGGTIAASKLDKLYKSIVPEQKYAGYDSSRGKSIYKDDIDKYVGSSEILIGKNADNLKCRNEILDYYEKYKKFIPIELIILAVLSIIALFLGNI